MFSDINKQIQIYSDSLLRALNRHVYFVCKQGVSSTLSPGVQFYKHHTSLLWLSTLQIKPTGHRMVERLKERIHISTLLLIKSSVPFQRVDSPSALHGGLETERQQLSNYDQK